MLRKVVSESYETGHMASEDIWSPAGIQQAELLTLANLNAVIYGNSMPSELFEKDEENSEKNDATTWNSVVSSPAQLNPNIIEGDHGECLDDDDDP